MSCSVATFLYNVHSVEEQMNGCHIWSRKPAAYMQAPLILIPAYLSICLYKAPRILKFATAFFCLFICLALFHVSARVLQWQREHMLSSCAPAIPAHSCCLCYVPSYMGHRTCVTHIVRTRLLSIFACSPMSDLQHYKWSYFVLLRKLI